MSTESDIGQPLPRGVVDVQRGYVGAAGKPGLEKQLAQLRREIGDLRCRVEDGYPAPDRSVVFSLIAFAAGAGAVATAVFIRNRVG